MSEPPQILPDWVHPTGLDAVLNWADAQLSARRRTGEPDRWHIRPWSVVCRLRTTGAPVYFKAQPPSLRGEVGLSLFLSERWPERVAPVIAADSKRGWLLMETVDGELLRGCETSEGGVGIWCGMLAEMARFHRDTLSSADALIAAGCRDGRIECIPALFDDFLSNDALLRAGDDALDSAEIDRLWSFKPALEASCRVLADVGAPQGLVHNDLHDGNVFRGPSGGFTFFDWGDCFVAPVFADALIALRVADARFKWAPEAPERQSLIDAFLSPWQGAMAPEALKAAFAHAMRIAPLYVGLTWKEIATTPGGEARAVSVARWARHLLKSLEQPPLAHLS